MAARTPIGSLAARMRGSGAAPHRKTAERRLITARVVMRAKTPMQTFIDTLPVAKEKLMQAA